MNRRQWMKLALGAGAVVATGGLASGMKGPFRSPEPLPDGPILDMHVHVAGIGAGGSGCYLSPAMRNNWRYRIYLQAFGTSQSELEAKGDAYAFDLIADGIDRSRLLDGAVILALDGVVVQGELDLNKTEVYIPSDFVAAQTRRHPHLFYGASINPYRHDAIERLDRAAEDGAVLVKWLPNIQRIRADDPALKSFYKRLEALNLPLLTHTGAEHSFSRSENALGDPVRLQLPLEMGVQVIAAHAGYSGSNHGEANVDRLLQMMPLHANLYADISSLTQINKHFALNRVLHAGIDDRLLYGSDSPLINTPLVSPWQYLAELPWREVQQIRSQVSPWDRDVLLKGSLGVPAQVFTRSAEFLKVDI